MIIKLEEKKDWREVENLTREHSILEQLNKPDNNNPISSDGILGIPKVYLFD